MKQCPACKNTYTDNTLAFCLSDGTALISYQTEEVTQQLSPANNPIRVNIAPETSPNAFTPTYQPTPSKSGIGWIFGLLVGLFLLAILGLGGIGAWFFLRSGNDKPIAVVENKPQNQNISNTPISTNITNSTNNTVDETSAMKQKLADLEKQIKDQKAKVPTVPTISTAPATPKVPTVTTAKVSSPGDGFLALRTGPSSTTGERIMEIPHGATVTVSACQAAAKGKKGKWCKVNYNGNAGWAFDGFLIY
jgi:Bacterial SH3 domain